MLEYFKLLSIDKFLIILPAFFGLISKTKVFFLQKTKFANPAPCNPIINFALLKIDI